MPKYCDTKQLELVWGGWTWAQQSMELEWLRQKKLLYTKDLGAAVREHVIPIAKPILFKSIVDPFSKKIHYYIDGKPFNVHVLSSRIGNAECNFKISQHYTSDNYIMELTKSQNWESLLTMIYMICNGVAIKFERDEDDRAELAHEALNYVVDKKLSKGKLNYTPGRAPVFNLMTTAIIRVMCSLKNKANKNRENIIKLGINLANKAHLPSTRSLSVAATMEQTRCRY